MKKRGDFDVEAAFCLCDYPPKNSVAVGVAPLLNWAWGVSAEKGVGKNGTVVAVGMIAGTGVVGTITGVGVGFRTVMLTVRWTNPPLVEFIVSRSVYCAFWIAVVFHSASTAF